MKILLATNNKDKIKEIKYLLKEYEIYTIDDILFSCDEIIENGLSFKENALIKSRAIFSKLNEKQKKEFIVLSDDSGISVKALNNAPGIYSARFSKEKTTQANRAKLIKELKNKNIKQSPAFYTACIGLSSYFGDFVIHGFMYGKVIDIEKGQNGFGYDSLFVPKGFEQTLGELDDDTKATISHRYKAIKLIKILLDFFISKIE